MASHQGRADFLAGNRCQTKPAASRPFKGQIAPPLALAALKQLRQSVAQILPDIFLRVDPGLTPGLTRGGAGDRGGSGMSEILAGKRSFPVLCHPA